MFTRDVIFPSFPATAPTARNATLRPQHSPHFDSRHSRMASHVPFLAVRPNEQFSTEINAREFATPFNSITTSSAPNMDSSEAPILSRVTPASASRIPAALRFVLVCFSSFALSALLYTLSVDWAGYELAAVSRDFTGQWQTGMVVARKMTELSVAWYAGYDCM